MTGDGTIAHFAAALALLQDKLTRRLPADPVEPVDPGTVIQNVLIYEIGYHFGFPTPI